MAVARSTFGSTLSDLQRLTNEDRAMDYQRANFQDDINARRLSEFLKARSEENKTKSQRDSEAARMLDAQQARAQQGQQFNTQQGNLMEIERGRNAADVAAEAARAKSALDLATLQGASAKEIATIQGQNRQIDPRFFDTLASTEALNSENKSMFDYATQLSERRKQAAAELKAAEGDNWGPWNSDAYNTWKKTFGTAPNKKKAIETLAQLDSAVKGLRFGDIIGLAVDPVTGGYMIPPLNQVKVPAMLNQGGTPVGPTPVQSGVNLPYVPEYQAAPATDPFPFLSTDAPPARTPAPPVRKFKVTPDNQFMSVP